MSSRKKSSGEKFEDHLGEQYKKTKDYRVVRKVVSGDGDVLSTDNLPQLHAFIEMERDKVAFLAALRKYKEITEED